MRLKTQIILGFLFLLTITLILSGVFIYFLNKMSHNLEAELSRDFYTLKVTNGLILSNSKMDRMLSRLCLADTFEDQVFEEFVLKESEIFEHRLNQFEQGRGVVEVEDLLKDLKTDHRQYLESIGNLANISAKKDYYFNVLQQQNSAVQQKIMNVNNVVQGSMIKEDQGIQPLYYNARVYVFIFTVFIMIIGLVAIYQIPQIILGPLNSTTDKIKWMADGNYDQHFDDRASGEVGELGKAVKILCEKLSLYEATNLAELKAQKRRIESIIKNLKDGLLLLNENKEIIIVNDAASEILGAAADQLVGKQAFELARENDVIRDVINGIPYDGDRREDGLKEDPKNFIKVNPVSDAPRFYTKQTITVYDDMETGPHFLGYIITLKDITSYKKSDEAKTNFIATVSHELKTPLSAMNMSLMLLQDMRFGTLNEDQKKIATSMKGELQRLIRMVTELLDLSKVETGNIHLDKKKIDPHLLIEYAIAPVQGQLQEKNLFLRKVVDKQIDEVEVDSEKISWVIINFLNNAIRYSDFGKEIVLQVRKEDECFVFSVQDFGPGISSQDLPKVFDKFVQLKSGGKDKSGSLGLGLAISKEVIEVHGGTIGVDSEPGKGSTFYFRLSI